MSSSKKPERDSPQIRVEPYTIEKLTQILVGCFNPPATTLESVVAKNHLGYFRTYFSYPHNKAKTIVIEEPYTDRDFLEDYAAFYVRCLDKYRSRCCRLHFFANKFDQVDLDSLILGGCKDLTADQFRDPENYLGFVVVRPLPETLIGRTCLRTYPDYRKRKDSTRHYPVTRDYEVHLAGFTLKVKSLAFQEQDRAASACATSALWSAFNATAKLFGHKMYTPVEITRQATDRVPGTGRTLPNSGLTIPQIVSAIKEVGLEPEGLEVQDGREHLQGIAYAYLQAGIPVLLVVSLWDAADPSAATPYCAQPDELHAVTVTGFSLGGQACVPHPLSGTLLKCTRIDKLYVHDDQVGPFAKLRTRAKTTPQF